MKVYTTKYKNLQAVQVETDKFTAVFIPSEGGKMASLKDKTDGKEYLVQNPSKDYLTLGEKGDYVNCECSGFDDMFPTIDEVSVLKGDEKVVYPDHGEVCRMTFEYKIESDLLFMWANSNKLGYYYSKRVYEDNSGFIGISYEIENLSSKSFETLWAGHCLINAEKNGEIVVPFNQGEQFDLMFDTNCRFGQSGDRLTLEKQHLECVWQDDTLECRKYYFVQKCIEGFVAYKYSNGKRLVMNFDNDNLPYLGIWINFGYINGYYCIGLEPCSVGYDTVNNAKKYGQSKVLKPNEKMIFSISLGVV